MSEEFCGNGDGLVLHGDLTDTLAKHIGETVTIFTTSGGMSGCGFTGVLLAVNECFVKLITQIGPAPGCALGNTCTGTPYAAGMGCMGEAGDLGNMNNMNDMNNGYPIRSIGSVTDIPIRSIASFVHNAV